MESAPSPPGPASSPVHGLAAAVRARRKELRLTQIALSRLAGCGPDFVYDLEGGKSTLRLDKLLDVLDVLGLELVLDRGKGRLRVAAPLVVSPPVTARRRRKKTTKEPKATGKKTR